MTRGAPGWVPRVTLRISTESVRHVQSSARCAAAPMRNSPCGVSGRLLILPHVPTSSDGGGSLATQRALAALATTLAILLWLASACALGAQTRKLVNSFGGASSAVPDPAPLASPHGVAIEQSSGDVYV